MKIINRSALLVRPKEPYVQWAKSFDESDTVLSLEEHLEECIVYLIDEVMEAQGLRQILRRHYKSIFEYELAAWIEDDSTWPPKRDLDTFMKWFAVECHSVVCDIADEELLSESVDT